MNYYYDTEFIEGVQDKKIGKLKIGTTMPTIDLISIGIVSEDDRQYYEISKDFNLEEAWNRFQWEEDEDIRGDRSNFPKRKVYWIRDNVLRSIFVELKNRHSACFNKSHVLERHSPPKDLYEFNYQNVKWLLAQYGKSNAEIASEVFCFVNRPVYEQYDDGINFIEDIIKSAYKNNASLERHRFYGYYADYDHVVLCWLYGKMNNLPDGFPMYTYDLKQLFDEKADQLPWYSGRDCWSTNGILGQGSVQNDDVMATLSEKIFTIQKRYEDYPKNNNAHDALLDALWTKRFHEFILKNFK